MFSSGMDSSTETTAVAGIVLVPTRFVWPYGGRRVFLTGSFTRWSEHLRADVPSGGLPHCISGYLQLSTRLSSGDAVNHAVVQEPKLAGFADLSAILDPGRPVKTDKSAILSDAIHVLNQLRTEAQELKDTNEKLQEDIKNLKVEKNELREEKLLLKADKERMEQQVRAMTVVPAGYLPPPHPASYQPGVNKMMAFPGYGGFPMWHWIPPAARDTSQDHELRPPVA